MNEDSQSPADQPKNSEDVGSLRKDAEDFGTVPKHSETFGTVRNNAEAFGNVRAQRKESHTLTVREAAKLFESAGVARTERSIINWCQPNRQGVTRLDCYFDPNERKYFITPQSVDVAIMEEQARAVKQAPSGDVPKPSEGTSERREEEAQPDEIKALKQEIMDLKITNRGKDFFIEQLRKERETNIEQLMTYSRKVGELETRILQLSAPGSESPTAAKPKQP